MIDKAQFQQMQEIDITKVDRSTLADIKGMSLDSELSEVERMKNLLTQIGNPYCFLCGDTPVKIRFVRNDKPLKQSLSNYFLSLK